MRIVIFTSLPDFERSPWWPIIRAAPGLGAVLLCRKVRARGLRQAAASLRRNILKHGPIFIPYRLAYGLSGRLGRRPDPWLQPETGQSPVPCQAVEATDIHATGIVDAVRAFGPDIGISIGAPILRPSLFGVPARGTINLHSGKVPDFRGAPPGFWELFTGAGAIGATVHWVDERLDTGPVIAHALAPIYSHDSLADVEARASELGQALLGQALAALAAGDVAGSPQPPGGRTFRQPTVTQRGLLRARLAWRHSLRRLTSVRFLVRSAVTAVWLAVVRPIRDLVRTVRRQHPVRVFTFHRVTTLCRDGMTVSPAVFSRQIRYLTRWHEVATLDRALELIASGVRLRRPVAVVTFDDGYRSVYRAARPILARAAIPACCFLTTDLIDTTQRFVHDEKSAVRDYLDVMSWIEIKQLVRDGWSVGGHTAAHPRLADCDAERLRGELERPLAALRERIPLGRVAMAYPFGGASDITPEGVDAVRAAGYAALFSDYGGENFAGDDLHQLRRIELGGDHDWLAWRARVHGLSFGARRSRSAKARANAS